MFDGPDLRADDPKLAEIKAQWVESVRPIVAKTPRWQRTSVQAQLLSTMECAGWSHDEATQIIADLFSERRGLALPATSGAERVRLTSIATP